MPAGLRTAGNPAVGKHIAGMLLQARILQASTASKHTSIGMLVCYVLIS